MRAARARIHVGSCVAGLLGLMLAGCLGVSPTRAPRLFVLDATAPVTDTPRLDLSIGVGPIQMPDRIDRLQIVTRTGDNEVELADFEQWAEPLDHSFARVVAENLARTIPTDQVAVYPWTGRAALDWRVEIDVTRFERDPDQHVTLAARWRLVGTAGGETVRHGASTFREVPEQATTESAVAAMSRAVGQLSADIARAILPAP